MDEQMTDYVPGGFSLIPEGEYTARVQATLDETKKEPKRLMVVFQFTVAEGDSEGKKVFDRTVIEDNKVGAQICRGRLEDLGYTWPDALIDVEGILDDMTSNPPLVVIQVTHETSTGTDDRTYTNARIRIIDVLENTAAPSTPTETAPAQAENEDPNLAGLLALCGSYQLDYISDDMNTEQIVEALKAQSAAFKEEDLQPDELTMLESVAVDLIERKKVVTPEKVATPARKIAPKTPAKQAPKVKGRGTGR